MEISEDFRLKLCDTIKPSLAPRTFCKKVVETVNALGFSDIDVALNSTAIEKNNNELGFLISTAPIKIYETYVEEKLFKDDLVLDYILTTKKPTLTAQAMEFFTNSPYSQSTRIQQCHKILLLFKENQYHDSYTIPIPINQNTVALVSIMNHGDNTKEFKRKIKHAEPYLKHFGKHIARVIAFPGYLQTMKRNRKNNAPLTQKEIQVITALAKYPLTQNEAAIFLNLSERGIQDRIKSIKNKLDAKTLYECIYKATSMELII